MHMVGHDNELVQQNIRADFGRFEPFVLGEYSVFIEDYFRLIRIVIPNFPQYRQVVFGTYRYEVRPGCGVIEVLEANSVAVVDFRVIFQRFTLILPEMSLERRRVPRIWLKMQI